MWLVSLPVDQHVDRTAAKIVRSSLVTQSLAPYTKYLSVSTISAYVTVQTAFVPGEIDNDPEHGCLVLAFDDSSERNLAT